MTSVVLALDRPAEGEAAAGQPGERQLETAIDASAPGIQDGRSERGVYRRDADGLAFLGEPPGGDDPSALASPVCYAGEVSRD